MNRELLTRTGFKGFVGLRDLPRRAATVPAGPGAYAVVREADRSATFTESSTGGRFKGRDPAVAVATLEAKWVDGAEILYLGKAGSLRERLDYFARFGRGEPIGHWGGRYLWQLDDCDSLLVAWLEDPDPAARETALIDGFVDLFGVLPFANINRPKAR